MTAPVDEVEVGANPYVGPRSFQKGEHLYGRSREGTELLDLLVAERIVLLYSPSGAGKSSLINAVIIPGMEREGFFVGPVLRISTELPAELAGVEGVNRYVYSIINSLEGALPKSVQLPPAQVGSMTLRDYLPEYRKRAGGDSSDSPAGGALLLIFDQFEEILRVNAADLDVKRAFFEQLGDLLRNDRSLWALLAIREDYLAAMEAYARPIPNRLTVTYRLDFLDARAAIEAIQGPARDSGVNFEPEAAKLLTDNLRKIRVQQADGTTLEQNGPYVEPVQLQVVCRRLWDKAAQKKVVTSTDVMDAGNIDDALGDYYAEHVEKASGQSGVGERQIREWFDRKLITPIGIRGNVLMEPESSSGLPNSTIKILQEAYLVRADQRGNAVWFELAHDRLTRPVRRNNSEWFVQHLGVFQRQADFWQLQGKPESLILSGKAYLEAEDWVKEHPEVLEQPGPEKEFLEVCRQKHRIMVRDHRLNTTIRWASLGLLVVTAAAVFFFFRAQDKEAEANRKADEATRAQATAVVARDEARTAQTSAQTNKNVAEVRGIVAESVNNLFVDPKLSVKLAINALDTLNPSKSKNDELLSLVVDALRRSLPAMRVEQVLTDPSIDPVSTQDHTFTGVSFDAAGTRMAAGSADGSLRVWSADVAGEPAKIIQVFQPIEGMPGVTSVAFSPDRKWLAAATGSGHVVLYDAESYDMKQDMAVQKSPILALAFNKDGSRLAVGGADGLAQIWNMQDTSTRLFLTAGEANVTALAFSPDGNRVAAGEADGTVKVWDVESGNQLYDFIAHKGVVSAVAFHPQKPEIATSGGDDRFINLWSLGNDAVKIFTISGHRDSVNGIIFDQAGTQLISVSSDRTVRFWDTEFGRPGMVLYGHTDQVYGVALSPDGNHIATTGKDLSVRVWNIAPEGSREYFTFSNGTPIHDLAISPDGSLMAAAGEDGSITLTITGSNTRTEVLQGLAPPAEAVAFNPDGKRIIAAGQDGSARIWNIGTGAEPLLLQGHKGQIWDAIFSPDGKQAVTAGSDGSIIIRDAQSGQPIRTLSGRAGSVYSLAYNKDGTRLAAGYNNSQIVLWDPETGEQVALLKGHTDAVRVVIFAPDGTLLASAGDDGSIRLWDMTSDPVKEVLPALRKNGDAIFALAFTGNGKYLFSGGADGIGTIWDMEKRAAEFHTYGQTDRISGAAISPDGAYLFTGGWDGTLRMHVFATDKLVELAKNRDLGELTEAECRQALNSGCPQLASVVPTPTPLSDTAAQSSLNVPSPSLYPAEAGLVDLSSAGANGLLNARFKDNYQLNIYERPFNGDMSEYYPDIDIQSAYLSTTQKWLYFSISLAGQSGGVLGGNYAIEMDLDGDGRGDYLVTTKAPEADWSMTGVSIWADKNRDVGGNQRYASDPPQTGDGYETQVFSDGSGEGTDLAWARAAHDSPNTIQIALLRSVIGRRNSFVWTAWASHDSFQPAWFDYNDHFTAQDVGSGNGTEGLTSLNELPGLDSTCRYPYGIESAKGDIFCRQ